jgi:16S rRNA (adenine1518-N6/adenine1519-N6)-dimethyltransferase
VPELPPLREIIKRHGLTARRGLGQHFLLDAGIVARIARAAGDLSHGTTIEIGPGPGGLTRALLAAGAAHVLAVELDTRCIPALEELAAHHTGRLAIVEGDALALDLAGAARSLGLPLPLRIVANLPYNVATALLLRWLGEIDRFESLTLMFQREVAERIAAAPGGKAYGRLAVAAQWRCSVERLFVLPPGAFVPPPRVHSAVIRLVPRARPLAAADPADLERVVAAAFGQRRKMLRSSLRSLGTDPAALLKEAALADTARAEELSVEQFCALARAYAARRVSGAA